MTFNTVILYDIENLLKGYNFSQQMAAKLSLEEIVSAIKQTERLGQIAVQRAYANWSDPRLAIMRGEINELGIDPIQVFGFSRDQKKNAADIQLAIDAIDLAHVRPAIQVFVIVSGDGGFASLAKKLHEYGKTVIGCAYQRATNKIFQAVCDDFVWISDPEEGEHQERAKRHSGDIAVSEVTDPHNVKLASKIKKVTTLDPQAAFAKANEVLTWYAAEY
ncbi:MAG: NYN domain-containing protein, partial [Gammaproteobacteria bacterium]